MNAIDDGKENKAELKIRSIGLNNHAYAENEKERDEKHDSNISQCWTSIKNNSLYWEGKQERDET